MLLGLSHIVIVPSKSDFDAGYEMVCAEAVLADRPIVASAVCPAIEDLRAAWIEVQPDNVDQYCRAILRLSEDPEFYSDKQSACAALHEPFYNPDDSWAAKIKEAVVEHVGVLDISSRERTLSLTVVQASQLEMPNSSVKRREGLPSY